MLTYGQNLMFLRVEVKALCKGPEKFDLTDRKIGSNLSHFSNWKTKTRAEDNEPKLELN